MESDHQEPRQHWVSSRFGRAHQEIRFSPNPSRKQVWAWCCWVGPGHPRMPARTRQTPSSRTCPRLAAGPHRALRSPSPAPPSKAGHLARRRGGVTTARCGWLWGCGPGGGGAAARGHAGACRARGGPSAGRGEGAGTKKPPEGGCGPVCAPVRLGGL